MTTASSSASLQTWSTSTAANAPPGSSAAPSSRTTLGVAAQRALGGPTALALVQTEVEQGRHHPAGAVAVQVDRVDVARLGVAPDEQHVEDPQRAAALEALQSADEPAFEVRLRSEAVEQQLPHESSVTDAPRSRFTRMR